MDPVRSVLVLLTVHVLSSGARSLGGRAPGNDSSRHDVLLLLGLLGDQAPALDSASVLLLVDGGAGAGRPVDPNVVLMLENFEPGGRSSVPRPARDSSAEDMDEMDSARPPSKYLSPPPAPGAGTRAKKNSNKVSGRSISSAHVSNQPVEEEERGPDFLTSLVTIPQVWMSEVSHLIIQPLRKPNPGERDSYEYFGMVAKAPFINCPLGFKKSSLGNCLRNSTPSPARRFTFFSYQGTCRPVFRSRREYPASEASEAFEALKALETEHTTTNAIAD